MTIFTLSILFQEVFVICQQQIFLVILLQLLFYYIHIYLDSDKKNTNRVVMLPGKLGEPGKVGEFENFPENPGKSQGICKLTRKSRKKSGDLKIDLKIRKKSGNFIKLTDWQSPIERASHQCQKQNVSNSGLESHTCYFLVNSLKSANYLVFNSL